MSNAIIELNKEGDVLKMRTSASGEEYGTLMVSSSTLAIVNQVATVQKRVAFIPVFKDHVEVYAALCKAGQPVPFDGKIVRTETTVEQYEGHQPVQYADKTSGEMIIHMVNGAPIYRQDLWAGADDSDTIITSNATTVATASVSAEAEA